MSQNTTILAYLKLHPMTSRQASRLYDIDRLSARIHELRRSHEIETEYVGKSRYARYRLVK
jgi:hypothetical protein